MKSTRQVLGAGIASCSYILQSMKVHEVSECAVEETSLPETLNMIIQIGPELSFYYSG